MHRQGYIVSAQGYSGGVFIPTLKEAQKAVRCEVKKDLKAARRKWGQAVSIQRGENCWEVACSRDSRAPMWSRYYISRA